MRRLLFAAVTLLALSTAFRLHAAPGQTPAPARPPAATEGIPITNATVKAVCGDCHAEDSQGRMSRISYRRTTPEGWQETIRRMATLNKAEIDPVAAREIVKYLADTLGLAPEEARPGAFEVERRLIDYRYTAHADTANICSSCHSMGRVILQRRTGEEWDLVLAMHRGWYPLVDSQVFRRFEPPSNTPGPDGRPPDNRHPMDKALGHLRGAFPLTTPEWTAWSATMRSARLEGEWALSGRETGEGPFFGRVTVRAGANADEFTTAATYTYARSGRTVTRTGRAVVYTGFQWRGRTTEGGNDATSLREVMFVERDWQSMSGRWFTGAYDEIGLDVTLVRIGPSPIITGFDRPSLRAGGAGQRLRIFGANLPAALTAADVDLGRGVTVVRVASAAPGMAELEVDVAADAARGARDVFLAGAWSRASVAIYDTMHYLKIAPAWNMARVGGVMYPKMLARFEAVAWHHGADGKPETDDDFALGPVEAVWSLEEYTATFDDDDIRFVGEIDRTRGVFTPAVDGPNPKRSGNRNNVGDVWVVATHDAGAGRTLRARAHLVVTVPLYLRWDFFTLTER